MVSLVRPSEDYMQSASDGVLARLFEKLSGECTVDFICSCEKARVAAENARSFRIRVTDVADLLDLRSFVRATELVLHLDARVNRIRLPTGLTRLTTFWRRSGVLPRGLFEGDKLTYLWLDRGNDAQDYALTRRIAKLRNLEELHVERVKAAEGLPPQMLGMARLRRLRISERISLPAWIGELEGLQELELASAVSAFPALSTAERLKILKLRHPKLDSIPHVLDLRQLRALDVLDSGLTALPPALARGVPSLQYLSLRGSKLTEFPPPVCDAVNLTRLDIGRSRIRKIGPEIGTMRCVRVLLLDGNLIDELPVEMAHLERLEELDLSGNPLSQIHDCVFPPAAPASASPQWSRRGLSRSPSVIKHRLKIAIGDEPRGARGARGWVSLRTLRLARTKLDAFPAGAERLPSLRSLSLSGCGIGELPDVIGALPLEELAVASCGLSQLPPELGKCANLESLDLSHNPLRNLPAFIGEFMHLRRVSLAGKSYSPSFVRGALRVLEALPSLKALRMPVVFDLNDSAMPQRMLRAISDGERI